MSARPRQFAVGYQAALDDIADAILAGGLVAGLEWIENNAASDRAQWVGRNFRPTGPATDELAELERHALPADAPGAWLRDAIARARDDERSES